MHDLDRTTLESDFEQDAFDPYSHEAETLGEHELNELAGQLLEVSSEHELEYFLDTLSRAFGGLTNQLSKQLRPLAGKLLHSAAVAAGNAIVPGVGGPIAGALGAALGLELEGLSSEDQEFHMARRLVELLAHAIRGASQSDGDPRAIARAFQAAAQRRAPGLIHLIAEPPAPAMPPPTAPAPHGELMTEADEMELAGELLEVRSEAEADHFVHGLIGASEQVLGEALAGPVRNAVIGHAKQLLADRLPCLARAVTATIGGAGAAPDALPHGEPDGQGESYASDAEYEAARGVVRVIADATRGALATAGGDPLTVARQAIEGAVTSLTGQRPGRASAPVTATEGRWFRHDDDHIVVVLGK